MEEKKNIPSNSIYTAVYKKGKVTNEYIPLLDIKLKGKVSLKDKLLEYENLFGELVAKNNYQQKEINKLTETLNQLINATTNSFKTVMDEMKKMSFYKKERVYKMKRKTFKHNKIFIVLGLILFMFVLIGGFSSFKVKGLDPIDETPPVEEVIPEEVIPEEVIPEEVPIIVEEEKGFFETLIIGLFNFLSSAEFTAFVTSASIVIVTIYSIIRPFLKIKQQVKYDKLMQDLKNKDEKLDKYEQLLTGYAQIADSSLKQSNAIKESLQLGFDKSNLKQDVKDKILNTLKSVDKINIPAIKETIINDLVEPLKEEINDSNIEPKITIPKGVVIMAQETSSSLRKKLLKTNWKEYLKKRWLYFLGFIFIYVIPLIVVIEKLVKIKTDSSNTTDISFSLFGFILGIVYIVFISKKIKTKINDMKIGFLKTLLVGISNIIPFATVGFLAHLISNGLSGFNITIWAICGSMLIGSSLQALDFFLNKDFLYDLELKKIAVEKVLAEKKEQDIRDEIEAMGD